MEEEARRLAVKTLEELYCMNCFQLREQCHCNQDHSNETPQKETDVWEEQRNKEQSSLEEEEELDEGDVQEQEFDIMSLPGGGD